MLYNPYRKFDKGMDDAYMGKEPNDNSAAYSSGYERSLQIIQEQEEAEYRKAEKKYWVEQEKQYYKDLEEHYKNNPTP